MSHSVASKVKTDNDMITIAEILTVLHVFDHAHFVGEYQVQSMCPFTLPESGGLQNMLVKEQVLGAVDKPMGVVALRCCGHSQLSVDLGHVQVSGDEYV